MENMRGLLVVGHGSRRDQANATVRELARQLAADICDSDDDSDRDGRLWSAVQPSFLELVEPDIAAGYAALARAGCTEIVVHPFFLFAGNHTSRDIPAELTSAQRNHPGTRWTMTEPLGLHPGVVDAARARIDAAVTASPTPPGSYRRADQGRRETRNRNRGR